MNSGSLNTARQFLGLIKFEHTVFALPFAYLGMLLASDGEPPGSRFWWITLAMVSARTAAMTLNRIIDRSIDARNPRTRARALVTGTLSMRFAWIATAVSLLLFFTAAGQLNPLCFRLAFAALPLLVGYHYVKRFHYTCHFFLGAVLAMAPYGGWIAVTGELHWQPLFLAFGVLFWVAGFDILYSLQDMDFDRAHGLHSVPVRFGHRQALRIASGCHLATLGFLAFFGLVRPMGFLYWIGLGLVAFLLQTEHRLMKRGELTHLRLAFFNVNGWVGILLLIFTFLETFR